MCISRSLLCCAAGLSLAVGVQAADWPSWRGPQADGISQETIKPSGDVAWTKELGLGYSAVTVKDGKLLTAGNIDNVDYIYCLDPVTGKEIWKYSQAADKGKAYAGPLSTPVTDGELVWFCNRFGEVICLDFATGKKLWSKDMTADTGDIPEWHVSSSVVIYQDLALIGLGEAGAALNKKTGDLVWHSKGIATHSSPTLMKYKGTDYALIMSGKFINVVNPKDGTLITRADYPQMYDITGASPVVVDADRGEFLVCSGYKTGRAILFAFDGKQLTKVWEVKHLNSQFSTPVLHDGVLYGSDGNTNARKALRAVDAKTGALLWKGSLRFGSPMIAGDKLVYLDERGGLHYLNFDKSKEDIISSHDVKGKGKYWQMPVLANGYLYCRSDKGSLVAIKVS